MFIIWLVFTQQINYRVLEKVLAFPRWRSYRQFHRIWWGAARNILGQIPYFLGILVSEKPSYEGFQEHRDLCVYLRYLKITTFDFSIVLLCHCLHPYQERDCRALIWYFNHSWEVTTECKSEDYTSMGALPKHLKLLIFIYLKYVINNIDLKTTAVNQD